jgi:hypothetical protein
MNLTKTIKKLCTPAVVYLLLSALSLILLVVSYIGNKNTLCVGDYECPVDNLFLILIFKACYIGIITIILNSLCKNGWGIISWVLVFFPIFFFFVVLGIFLIYQKQSKTIVLVEQQ